MSNGIESVDVCIIGASIAGNYLAYLLRNSGLKIAVIEDHTEIGVPLQCAGIISQKLSQLIDLPDEIVLNRVKVAKVISPSGKFIKLSGEEQPYIVDRVALDKLFYQKVMEHKNITFYLGEKFTFFKYKFKRNQKYIEVETSKRLIQAKLLIGCDGPYSKVAKQRGVWNKVISAAQIRIKAPQFDPNEAIMYFDPRWKELFGWVVPEGDGVCRIGLASYKNTSENFNIFLKKLNIKEDQKVARQGGLIPYGIMKKVAFDNVLLLGDSGGQVKATTGGGIVMLLTAAKYAASSIIKSFKLNNFSQKHFKKYYEIPCKSTIGRQLKIHYIIRAIFASFKADDFDTFFQIVKSSNIEQIISFYGDMDFPKSLLFRMLRNSMVIKFLFRILKKNPSLLGKVVKALIY